MIRRSLMLGALVTFVVVALPQAALAQTYSSSSGLNPAVLLVPAVVFAVICGFLANSKGTSVALWAVLGFLFGLIALIILAFLKKQPSASAGGGTFSAPSPPRPP